MSTWTDDRIEAALGRLAGLVDLPIVHEQTPATVDMIDRRRPRRLSPFLVAALVLTVVIGTVAAVPGSRRAVAEWFGIGTVSFHRTADPLVGTATLVDEVGPLAVDQALREFPLTIEQLEQAGLGRPDTAGQAREGAVVLGWSHGAVTLWATELSGALQLNKSFPDDVRIVPLPQISDGAVLIDGPHDLVTPIRVVADRVVWWGDETSQFRLEGDLSAGDLVAIADALAG
ncbi:MAG: hypothetical protein ACK5OX_12020 [Desertimonas sp.]